jgi:phenylalanine-4-hydroxylase
MSPRDLRAYAIYEAEKVTLEFEGDIIVTGKIVTGSRNLQGEILLIKFINCTVTHKDQILFQPEWGTYDMVVGKKVISAFSGPADVNSFDMINHVPSSHTIKAKKSVEREELEGLYLNIRNIREGKTEVLLLEKTFETLKENHPKDWLLTLEIAELCNINNNTTLLQEVLVYLEKVKQNRTEIGHLIDGGLELFLEKVSI